MSEEEDKNLSGQGERAQIKGLIKALLKPGRPLVSFVVETPDKVDRFVFLLREQCPTIEVVRREKWKQYIKVTVVINWAKMGEQPK